MVSSKARRGSVFLAGAMLAVAASTVACAAVLGFERLSEDGAPETGAPEGSSTDGPVSEAGPACAELGLPAKPVVVDAGADAADGAGEPGLIHVAMNVLDLGIDPNAPAVGLNLDGVCSPTVATSSCATRVSQESWDIFGKDTPQGLDNAGRGLLATLGFLGPAFRPDAINTRLRQGEFGLVFRISRYNGLPDDDEVLVELFPALGVEQLGDGGIYSQVLRSGTDTLTFNDTDRWIRNRRFLISITDDASSLRSSVAYVARGKLVASFKNLTLPLSVPNDPKPFDIVLQGFYLSADLTAPSGAPWRLSNGLMAGRWRTSDFLAQLRTVFIKGSGTVRDMYFCDPGTRDAYDFVKGKICESRDIRADLEGSSALPCDAFSSGIRFETYPVVEPGSVDAGPAIAPRCPSTDGGVPEGDDCPPAFP